MNAEYKNGKFTKMDNDIKKNQQKSGTKIICNGTLITPFETLEGMEILTNGHLIAQIRPERSRSISGADISSAGISGAGIHGSRMSGTVIDDEEKPEISEVIDAEGGYIFPGFVDIHTHGALGSSFMETGKEGYNKILGYHVTHGVTSLIATTLTAPVERLKKCIAAARSYMQSEDNGVKGSRVTGMHLEGPYLSVARKGAQMEEHLLVPEKDDYCFITDNADVVRIVTIAPELPGSIQMIRSLTEAGIVVSGGHDDAIDEEIDAAIAAGMSHSTHIYCGMSSLTKRNGIRHTGLSEASLTEDAMSTEMIADNQHLPPRMMKLIYKCKGAEKLCMVSDSIMAAGLPEGGRFVMSIGVGDEGTPIIVGKRVAMVADGSVYAGSIQMLDEMLRNVVNDVGVPLTEAIKMITMSPAKVIGVENEIGSIMPGKRADFCITDKALKVKKTIIGGKVVFGS